jgi:hypothetical protein
MFCFQADLIRTSSFPTPDGVSPIRITDGLGHDWSFQETNTSLQISIPSIYKGIKATLVYQNNNFFLGEVIGEELLEFQFQDVSYRLVESMEVVPLRIVGGHRYKLKLEFVLRLDYKYVQPDAKA